MKKRFKQLVQEAGYTSLGKLATLNRLSPQNLYSQIGKHPRQATIRKFANLLGKKPGEVQEVLVYEQELKDAFYEFEDLIEKIKANSDGDDLNMDQVEAHIQEYKKTIEHVIKDKILKDAKELIVNINSFKFHLVSELTDNAQDAQIVRRLNNEFSSIRWKDGTKARQLLNHCLQLANDGKTKTIRPILVQIVGLMHDGETLKDTLV